MRSRLQRVGGTWMSSGERLRGSGMSELVEFLRARLDEDEAVARAAVGLDWHAQGNVELRTIPHDSPGSVEPCWYQIARGGFDEGPHVGLVDYYRWDRRETFRHIARHDPARVLREVEAKRRVLWLYEGGDAYEHSVMETAVKALAAIYADHPDHRDEWR
jgi:hypothetical protein